MHEAIFQYGSVRWLRRKIKVIKSRILIHENFQFNSGSQVRFKFLKLKILRT